MNVVVSVDQWRDLTASLAGDCAEVVTIVATSSADPHDFEPTPADLEAFDDADLVVLNGLGYDAWARRAADTTKPDAVVDAGAVSGRTTGDNPHLWYGPDHVAAMTSAVREQLGALLPGSAAYLAERAAAWDAELQPYRDAVEKTRAAVAGRRYGATEWVFDEMAAAIGLVDETPAGYRVSAANGSEPGPADVDEFQRSLEAGSMEVLLANAQTEGALTDQLRDTASEAGVPVVEVTETVPSGTDFVAWQIGQLAALVAAVGR